MTARLALFILRHPRIAYRFHRAATAPWPSEVDRTVNGGA